METERAEFVAVVSGCWHRAHVELLEDDLDSAPSLGRVYEMFLDEVADEYYDIYEQFFGYAVGAPRTDWLEDIGCSASTIFPVVVVADVLRELRLPFLHRGNQYGFYCQGLLKRITIIEED